MTRRSQSRAPSRRVQRGRPRAPTGRERILDAALAVFAERGYEASSIAEIADRAGVAKSVIYHHFGSKAGLYEAILEDETAALVAEIAAALPADPDAPRMRLGLDAYLAFLERRPRVWELLFRDPPLDAAVREPYEVQRQRRTDAIAGLIAPKGVAASGRGPDKRRHIDLVITAVRSFTAWWYEHQDVRRGQVLDAILAVAAAGFEHLRRDSR